MDIINSPNLITSKTSKQSQSAVYSNSLAQNHVVSNTKPFVIPSSFADAQKAYLSPRITQTQKPMQVFNVSSIGQGKVYELKNGHKIIIIKKDGPTVINTFVKTDHDSNKHKSHLLEHLIFNTEKNVGDEKYSDLIGSLGLKVNAGTHYDSADYSIKYAFNDKANVDKLIKTQADLIQNFDVSEEKLEAEKKIILAEEFYRKANSKIEEDRLSTDIFFEKKEDNSLQKIEEDIMGITKNDLKNYHNQHYNNNNMITVVVGDVDEKQILSSFKKYFNKSNQQVPTTNKQVNAVQKFTSGRLNLESHKYDSSQIEVGFLGPKSCNKEDDFLSDVFCEYFNNIIDNKRVTCSRLADTFNSNESKIILFRTISEKESADKGVNKVFDKMSELQQRPLSDKELNDLKKMFKNQYSNMSELAETISYRVGRDFIDNGEPKFFNNEELIDKITSEKIQNFAKKYLNPNQAKVVVNNPKKENVSTSFSGHINKDHVEEFKLPNNLHVAINTSESTTRSAFGIHLESDQIPQEKKGAYLILRAMLNPKNYKDNFLHEMLGDSYESEVYVNLADINVLKSTLPENTVQDIKKVKEEILKPNFSQESFDIAKKYVKGVLVVSSDLPKEKKKEVLYKDYPLAPLRKDMLKDFDSITLDDVKKLHKQILTSSKGKAIISMPQSTYAENKTAILQALNSDFPILQPIDKPEHKFNVAPVTQTYVVGVPNKDTNATIEQTYRIPETDNLQDKAAIEMIAIILGDPFVSKLYKNIREEQNLSYVVGSSLDSDGNLATLTLQSSVPLDANNSSDLQKVLESYKTTINDLASKPVDKETLNTAKMILKSDRIYLKEPSRGKVYLLDEAIDSKYGLKYEEEVFKTIDSITPEQIQKVAQKYLQKPALIGIKAKKEVLENNQSYLSSIGETSISDKGWS